ncbi:endonuclease/exonuclease/phosphatase family protein [Antarcticimicrobium sediminis]|nr:endonuclease/exonuclease/phosphatase family protein [Antarcticimicrobium sediminis]
MGLRKVGWVGALAALVGVLVGYGGALHPAGDSLAVFRVPLAGLAGLMLVLLRRPRRRVLLGLAVVVLALVPRFWAQVSGVGIGSVAATALAAGQAPGQLTGQAAERAVLTIYQKNLLFNRPDPKPLVADIRARSPDIVTLQEVDGRNRAVLEALQQDFPYQQYCDYRAVGGTAVLSRWPAVPGSALCAYGLSALQVETPGGPVWAVALHLRWPWPYGQAEQLDGLEPVLRTLSGPKVIGGDFNSVAWSHAVTRVARASGTRRVGREAVSFALPYGGFGVGIDHVLASGAQSGTIQILERLGSDHRGVLARVSVTP